MARGKGGTFLSIVLGSVFILRGRVFTECLAHDGGSFFCAFLVGCTTGTMMIESLCKAGVLIETCRNVMCAVGTNE